MNLKILFRERADLLLLLIQSTIGFLFLPYLFSFVEIEVYGEIFLIQSSAVFFQLFYNLGYSNTITSYAIKWQTDQVYFEQISKVVILIFIKFALFLLSVFVLNQAKLIPENILQYAGIIVVMSLANVLKDIFDIAQRMKDRYRIALIFGLFYVIFDTILKIYYLNNFVFSPEIFLTLVTGSKIFFFMGLLFFLIAYNVKINKIKMKREDIVLFKFGLNWAIANALGKITAFIDKPVISNYIGLEVLGYYAFASKILAAAAQFRTMLKNLWIYDALNQYPRHKEITFDKLLKPGFFVVLMTVFLSPLYVHQSLGEWNMQVILYILMLALIEILWYVYLYSSLAPVHYKDSTDIPKIQVLSFIVYFVLLSLIGSIGIFAVFLGKTAQLTTSIVLQKRLELKLKNKYF